MTAPTTDGSDDEDADDLQPRTKRRKAKGMSRAMFHRSITALPGDVGWWSSSGHVTFQELGEQLLQHGFTTDDALAFLESAYSAVSGEYGQ